MRTILLVALLAILPNSSAAQVQPDPQRGLYAIWARDSQVQGLDVVSGGQVFLQWRDLQPARGSYDFARLDAALKKQFETHRPATIQVNGNRKPEFLYESVPCLSEKLSRQISDPRGSLMYWHPAHASAYLEFVEAFGRHVSQSAYRDAVLGVRLNFNALGTEHMHVPKAFQPASTWHHPPGVPAGTDWSREVMESYKRRVIAAFVKAFRPQVRVFIRNNVVLDEHIDPTLVEAFENGELALFHTSSEVEPRGSSTEQRYEAFLRWARPGKTVAYAESWASARGNHGGVQDDHWCSPCQWNYWRLLVDLHCGVSFIAVYGEDLNEAKTDPEFRAALEFADRYVGFHASPVDAPGAWVALREGEFLAGDYTFLMKRLNDPNRPVRLVGREEQRYGAWARQVPANGVMRFQIDPRFFGSRGDATLQLRLVYLDEGTGRFELMTSHAKHLVQLTNSGRWKIAKAEVSANDFVADADVHVTIRAGDDPLTLHMVEATVVDP